LDVENVLTVWYLFWGFEFVDRMTRVPIIDTAPLVISCQDSILAYTTHFWILCNLSNTFSNKKK